MLVSWLDSVCSTHKVATPAVCCTVNRIPNSYQQVVRNKFDVLTFLTVIIRISESAGVGVDPENKEKEYRSQDAMQRQGVS